MEQVKERNLARYAVIRELFETEGWRELIRELEDEIEVSKQNILVYDRIEDVKFEQGRVDQMYRMIHLSDTIANILDLSEDEDADV